MTFRFRDGKVDVSLRLSNNLVLSSVLVICVIIGVKTSKGYIAAGNEACLELCSIDYYWASSSKSLQDFTWKKSSVPSISAPNSIL